MDRTRALSRLKNLLRRARSSNEHEAAEAKKQAAEFAAKHGIAIEEAEESIHDDEGPSWRRHAQPIDPSGSWKAHLAVTVASRTGCRALEANGSLRFDGRRAGEAHAAFRRLAKAVEEACERAADSEGCAGPHGPILRAFFSAIFSAEAARAIADGSPRPSRSGSHPVPKTVMDDVKARKLSVHRLAEAACETGRRAGLDLAGMAPAPPAPPPSAEPPRPEPDAFSLRPGYVVLASRSPGNYATLFIDSDGRRLPFRRDASVFDDEVRRYEWAFAVDGPLAGRIVFATTDRAVVGEVEGEAVRTTNLEARVARTRDGEPMHVERILQP